MPSPNDLAERLEPIVAGAVGALGFDLDSLDVQQAGRKKLVKVVVDADDGIGLDEVAAASRAVSHVLDEHEHLIAGAYTLEVTSPGLSRPLIRQRHWQRAKFRLVKVTPKDGTPYLGRVGHAGEKSVRVLVDERFKDVAYAGVTSAVVEVEFKQPPADHLKLIEADCADLTGTEHGRGHTDGKNATTSGSASTEEDAR